MESESHSANSEQEQYNNVQNMSELFNAPQETVATTEIATEEPEEFTNPTYALPNPNKIAVKLFVGQVPKIWNESDIHNMFKMFGEIQEIQIIRDQNGNHRGCAFVKFASLTDADIAISSQNDICFLPGVLSNSKLQLKWADGESKRLGLDGYDLPHTNKIYITNFPYETNEQEIIDVFSKYGTIIDMCMKKDNYPSYNNRCYLKYKTKEESLVAIRETNGTMSLGRDGNSRRLECMLVEQKKASLLGQNVGSTQASNYNNNNRRNDNYGNRNNNQQNMGGNSGNYQNNNNGNYQNNYSQPSYNETNTQQNVQQERAVFIEYKTDDGVSYYYNTVSQDTQWERPENARIEQPNVYN